MYDRRHANDYLEASTLTGGPRNRDVNTRRERIITAVRRQLLRPDRRTPLDRLLARVRKIGTRHR